MNVLRKNLLIFKLIALALFILSNNLAKPQAPMRGSDRDEHGCIGSAGYSYCTALETCIRPWLLLNLLENFGLDIKSKRVDFNKICKNPKDPNSNIIAPEPGLPDVEAVFDTSTLSNSNDVYDHDTVVGNDRDSHNCIASAGYSWCETMNKCIRPWEHNLDQESFNSFCVPS